MTALDRVVGAARAVMEYVVGQIGSEADAVWHASFCNSTRRRRMIRMIPV